MKHEILKTSYEILIECFAGWHGEIFQEYWGDPNPEYDRDSDRHLSAYMSVSDCLDDLKDVYDEYQWHTLAGSEEFQILTAMIEHYSHGEVWGSVCSQLYYSSKVECWYLLAKLLEELKNKQGLDIGWDN